MRWVKITMDNATVVSVPFAGGHVVAVKISDEVYVAVKPICEAIGLDWGGQYKRIQRDALLREGMSVMTMPSSGGPQEAVYLSISLLNGWLLGVSETRVRPELRERLIKYRRECHEVLFNHFNKKNPEKKGPEQKLLPPVDWSRVKGCTGKSALSDDPDEPESITVPLEDEEQEMLAKFHAIMSDSDVSMMRPLVYRCCEQHEGEKLRMRKFAQGILIGEPSSASTDRFRSVRKYFMERT